MDDMEYAFKLLQTSIARDKAEAELRRVLKEDGDIADRMRDVWTSQQSEAEL